MTAPTTRNDRARKRDLPVPQTVVNLKMAEIFRLERELREAETRFAHDNRWSLGALAGVNQRSRDVQLLQQALMRSRAETAAMHALNKKAEEQFERERQVSARRARRRIQTMPTLSPGRRRHLEMRLRLN